MSFKKLKTFPAVHLAYQISLRLGTSVYLVGGAVRDAMMGFFYGKDFDFTLGDQWAEAAKCFAAEAGGKAIPWDFNQIRIVLKEHDNSVNVDFSMFKGSDIISDLRQRDFTINSMALDLASLFEKENQEVIDPLAGKDDLQKKVIRADSDLSFEQDPLRILRGLRFAREYDFSIETTTKRLMEEKAARLHDVSSERIKRELGTILKLPGAADTIKELMELQIMECLIPELQQFSAVRQGSPHQYDLLEHSLKTVAFLDDLAANPTSICQGCDDEITRYLNELIEEGVTRRSLLILTGLLHDSGKLSTRSVDGGRVRFLGHEQEGCRLNRHIAQRLRLGKCAQRIMVTITKNHQRILQLSQMSHVSTRAKQRLLKDIDGAALEVLCLALADVQATSTAQRYKKTRGGVKKLVLELAEELFSDMGGQRVEPLITGKDIMEILSIPEGPVVGEVLREVHAGESNGFITTREKAIQWLRRKKRSLSNS